MKKRISLSGRLLQDDTIVNNLLKNPALSQEIEQYGFDQKMLNNASNDIAEVRDLDNKQRLEFAEQYQAAENSEKAMSDFYKVYMKNIKLARLAFDDNTEARSALMLDGLRKQSFEGFFKQADAFYSTMLSKKNYLETVARFRMTYDMLEQQYSALKELANLNQIHQKEKGEASAAVKVRDEKMDKLDKFMAELIKVCKIAFEDTPDNLTILSIKH